MQESMVEIGNIITLENNIDYLVLEVADYAGDEYVYTVEVDKDDTPTGSFEFFKVLREAGEEYLKLVGDDEELKVELEEYFKMVVYEKIKDILPGIS